MYATFSKKTSIFTLDIHTYVCVSEGKKWNFFKKIWDRAKWILPNKNFKYIFLASTLCNASKMLLPCLRPIFSFYTPRKTSEDLKGYTEREYWPKIRSAISYVFTSINLEIKQKVVKKIYFTFVLSCFSEHLWEAVSVFLIFD